MDRRRALAQKRPPPSEEHDTWAKATSKMMLIGNSMASQDLAERVMKVNKLMTEAEHAAAIDDYELFKSVQPKLKAALEDLKSHADKDNIAITEALETLSVLKALRTAVEAAPVQEKRNKRQRMSPAVTNGTPAARVAPSPPLIQRATANGSRSHQKKAPPPLREGRMVGFRVPADTQNRDATEAEWILVSITKSAGNGEYIVQDADAEGGVPVTYQATMRNLLLIPDMEAKDPFKDVPIFSPGTMVLALYPETTSFYRAQVISGGPKDSRHNPAAKATATYRLKFDDDEDQEKVVSAQWVVEYPSS
ncbi:hypothetical protein EXIGLDRAFT_828689 [Exidia glandulosa HHB12029]|uniref:SGF29 C-terminal domain-containing protein n=1 Tax=Exidia glandulosa HHB12029 TaxID=1314781 RepID=A0A165QAR6_EXIGL|nr:hypothetical protein EXIGLDRAFT_828689 [Exidia glandulosa HHB12029]